MRRRTVVLGAAAGAMLAAAGVRAQQAGRQYRIGVLSSLAGLSAGPYLSALREALAKHGFVEGRNLAVDVRFPTLGRRPAMAAAQELLALKPDAILACTTQLALAAQAVAGAVPVVFTWVADPMASRIVEDLAQPGGNTTGVSNRNFELTGKRVELLRELLPEAKRVAVATGIFDDTAERTMEHAERTAERVGFRLNRIEVGASWSSLVQDAKAASDALLVMIPFAMFGMRFSTEIVVRHALEQRFPVIYADRETVDAGGLMSYATSLADDMRLAADLIARVLRGERPGDLSVNQASRFELAINLKTARAIGLTIPQSLLVRADRVIE